MDCRRWVVPGLALLLGVWGCNHQASSVPGPMPPSYQTAPPPLAVKQEKPEPKRPPMPETCVAAGEFFAKESAAQENGSTAQEEMREKARKAFQQALSLDPKCLPAYCSLAQLYTTMADHDHAISTYQKAIKLAPNEASLHFELGMCQARKKDWPSALESLQKAVDLDPENRPYVNTLGHALARAGRFQDSLACFRRIHGPGMAHYQLARMLFHLQQPEMGRRELELALQSDPDLEPARKLLAQNQPGRPTQDVQQADYQEAPAREAAQPLQGKPFPVEVKPQAAPASPRIQIKKPAPAGRILPPPPVVAPPKPPVVVEAARPAGEGATSSP
jgi:Tfp pilus assembly protein PilF